LADIITIGRIAQNINEKSHIKSGSPNSSIHRTFQAVFEMPVAQFNHNLIKIGKRKYRNPIYLAREWREALNNGEYASPADLSRHLKVSRARVTQILNLLRLTPEVIKQISSLGDPMRRPMVFERRLRPLLFLSPKEQTARMEIMLSKSKATQERRFGSS